MTNNVKNYFKQAGVGSDNDLMINGNTVYGKDSVLTSNGDTDLGESDYTDRMRQFVTDALSHFIYIEELTEVGTAQGSDEFAIARGSEVFKITADTLTAYVTSFLPVQYVFNESDLGVVDDIADTITLRDVRYIMCAAVHTDKRLILLDGATTEFYSFNWFDFPLMYTGTGTFITGQPQRLVLDRVAFLGAWIPTIPTNVPAGWPVVFPVNQLFDIQDGTFLGRATLVIDWTLFSGFNNMGTVDGFDTFALTTPNWATYTTGLTIKNGSDFLINGGRISNTIQAGTSSGPALTFEGTAKLIQINGMLFSLNGDESAIKIDSAISITEAIGINNCPINTENGAKLLDPTGLGKDDPRVQVIANGQSPDSITAGVISMRMNETVTPITLNTPVKIVGTALDGFLERFTNGDNRLTYVGLEEVTLKVSAEVRVTFAANLQGDTITLTVVKNGDFNNPIATDVSTLNAIFNNPTSPYLRAVDLTGNIVTDDYFEAWIESDGSDDIVVESLNLIIERAGG